MPLLGITVSSILALCHSIHRSWRLIGLFLTAINLATGCLIAIGNRQKRDSTRLKRSLQGPPRPLYLSIYRAAWITLLASAARISTRFALWAFLRHFHGSFLIAILLPPGPKAEPHSSHQKGALEPRPETLLAMLLSRWRALFTLFANKSG